MDRGYYEGEVLRLEKLVAHQVEVTCEAEAEVEKLKALLLVRGDQIKELENHYRTEVERLKAEVKELEGRVGLSFEVTKALAGFKLAKDEIERLKAELHSVRVHKNKGLLYKKDENDKLRKALEKAKAAFRDLEILFTVNGKDVNASAMIGERLAIDEALKGGG